MLRVAKTWQLPAIVLLAAVCLGMSKCRPLTGPLDHPLTGEFRGVMVGTKVSGEIAVTFPATAGGGDPTGTFAITGGPTVGLTGSQVPQGPIEATLDLAGGGYKLTGYYFAPCPNCGNPIERISGQFTGPGGNTDLGDWSVSAVGPRLSVYCGTHTGTTGSLSGGPWDFVVDDSDMVWGFLGFWNGSEMLSGSYRSGRITISDAPSFMVTGIVDSTTGLASGTWTDAVDSSGTWAASRTGC